MSSITIIVVLIGSIYLFTCLVRMYQYVREGGRSEVTIRLCLMGCSTGLTYLVGNYEIQRILHSYLKSVPIPIAPVLWLFTAYIMGSYLHLDTVRRFTVFHIPYWVSKFILVGVGGTVLANIILYRNIPFYRLQVLNSLIGSIIGIVAALSIAPMTRTIFASELKALHRVQFGLWVIQINALFIATVLLGLDSIYKLWFDISLIYTPLYIGTVVLLSIAIITVQMLNEGTLIYWAQFPAKVRCYFKLKRLYRVIQDAIQFPDAYNMPTPTIPLPNNVNTMTYRVFIMIADRYWRMSDDIPLKQTIETILNLDIPSEAMLQELAAVNFGKETTA